VKAFDDGVDATIKINGPDGPLLARLTIGASSGHAGSKAVVAGQGPAPHA